MTFSGSFSAWQETARTALHRGVTPNDVVWEELATAEPSLNFFDKRHTAPNATIPNAAGNGQFLVPKRFVALARLVSLHASEQRWALLYRLLWRLTHGEPRLLELCVDPDVLRAVDMEKAVRHEIHKMRAFVRFREIEMFGDRWFVAWFEPEHHVIEANAQFFIERFASMKWAILSPQTCLHWNGETLQVSPGVDGSKAPEPDNIEQLWLTYYRNIFNPARVKLRAMEAEMPKKYWKNLPETAAIPTLVRSAGSNVEAMMKRSAAKRSGGDDEWLPAPAPASNSLTTVREAAKCCTACPLYKHATQTVFGEGPKDARMMLIGEQPGDQEDVAGKPFVGPAGQIMNRALEEAGINRKEVYVTNAVKHFKWEPRGKRRIHQKPNSRDIAACRPWLEAELRIIQPELVVAMGATAAQTLFGPSFRVTRERGRVLESEFGVKVVATVHPSSLLRQPDEESREREYKNFVKDLRVAVKAAAK